MNPLDRRRVVAGLRSAPRINRVNYVNGAIAEPSFTRRFLRPEQFTGVNPA